MPVVFPVAPPPSQGPGTGRMLVREFMRRVSILLEDTDPQGYRHTEADMIDFANDGQVAISMYLPSACSRVDALKLRPGTLQTIELIQPSDCKPGDGSTPLVPIQGNALLKVVRNMGTDGLTPGPVIRNIVSKMLDAHTPGWHVAKTSAVISAYVYDPGFPRFFHVSPPVPATGTWIEVGYEAQPLRIPEPGGTISYIGQGSGIGATETIKIADQYAGALVDYVAARMLAKDSEGANSQKASVFANGFIGFLNARVSALTGSNPNLSRLPFTPATIGAAK